MYQQRKKTYEMQLLYSLLTARYPPTSFPLSSRPWWTHSSEEVFFSRPSRNWDRNLEHLVGLPPTQRVPITSTRGVWSMGRENSWPMEE